MLIADSETLLSGFPPQHRVSDSEQSYRTRLQTSRQCTMRRSNRSRRSSRNSWTPTRSTSPPTRASVWPIAGKTRCPGWERVADHLFVEKFIELQTSFRDSVLKSGCIVYVSESWLRKVYDHATAAPFGEISGALLGVVKGEIDSAMPSLDFSFILHNGSLRKDCRTHKGGCQSETFRLRWAWPTYFDRCGAAAEDIAGKAPSETSWRFVQKRRSFFFSIINHFDVSLTFSHMFCLHFLFQKACNFSNLSK